MEDLRTLERDLELRLGLDAPVPWQKSRTFPRQRHPDLQYLPQGRRAWNATLAALAFAERRQRGAADLGHWAVMHGARASARWAELGDDALVLWHGTSRQRAEGIRQKGLFHKRGLWATAEPRIAHGYARRRSEQGGAGSAMVVLVLDRRRVLPGVDFEPEGDQIVRFHYGLGPEHIEYICWPDRVEWTGTGASAGLRPWGRARFKRLDGRWVPVSLPPVRLDEERQYRAFGEWLTLSLERIVHALGRATALELLASLYATLDPWEALEHEQALAAAEAVCRARPWRGRILYEAR